MTVAGLPKFTVSFGVVEADPKDDLPTTISRADAALFQAKREGRDRVIVLDALGQIPVPAGPSESPTNGNGRVLNGREASRTRTCSARNFEPAEPTGGRASFHVAGPSESSWRMGVASSNTGD